MNLVQVIGSGKDAVSVTVGTIAPAWATDANGKPVTTKYKVSGKGRLTQVVKPNKNTVFPVVADPSIWLKIAFPYNFAFSLALGGAVRSAVYAAGGSCRQDTTYDIWTCWGGQGAIRTLDGYGAGTTYGSTYYLASGDPKVRWGGNYGSRMTHEASHYAQWITVGPSMAPTYLVSEGVSRVITARPGCGNIFEILAGLKSGGYSC